MKRFRRHGQESQRDRLKQELFQFNKASSKDSVCLASLKKTLRFVKCFKTTKFSSEVQK